jgi:perosamine synthetase
MMIPVNEPLIGSTEIDNVLDCVRTGWISSAGEYIKEFEDGWARYCGMKHGIAVSNGTTALEVAVSCLELQRDDEIIMPTFTIISCALAIVRNGCKPVLVDCDPHTWCMDVNQVQDKITKRTRAIMPVHIYGHPVDMDPLIEIAQKYNLALIEDAAEVHGAEYKGRKCGGIGDISTFSFYANKIITTGEGGMVLTDNSTYAEKARALRNLCFQADKRFLHTHIGHNFRMTNIQAAIGAAQIEKIDELVDRKRRMGDRYSRLLGKRSELQLPVERPWAKQVYWMYGVVLENGINLDALEFAVQLKDRGIGTRPFFIGMHEQPVFHKMGLFKEESYPVAERLARRGLYLPSGITLTGKQIDEVCDKVSKILSCY